MGKIKNLVILLLTILSIILAAFLPRIAGWMTDAISLDGVSYSPVPAVQLQLRENMPVSGKLALMCRMDHVIEISPELAELSDEEVRLGALAALEPYISSGLIPEFDIWSLDARALLIQTPDSPDRSGIIWSVIISGNPNGDPYICLDLDDTTGRLLRINFTDSHWAQSDAANCLNLFTSIYFEELKWGDYEAFLTDDLSGQYIGENTCGVRCRFADADYG